MAQNTESPLLLTVVRSLSFAEDRSTLLRTVSPDRWQELLALTDANHITLALTARCSHAVPEQARRLLESCANRNTLRHARIVGAHAELAGAMNARGVEFLILKGLTHTGLWNANPADRLQYDIDMYCPGESLRKANEVAASIGYAPAWSVDSGADHLPPLIRRTGWRWRGDYYDPEQPLALELHHRFWNPATGFCVHGEARFWGRRAVGRFHGIALPTLCPVDQLTFAAWHVLRHLLRGSLGICHVYELAHFLHYSAPDHRFWQEWRDRGPATDRLPELVAFRLAQTWFGCRLHPLAEGYLATLPAEVDRWFQLFAFSPLAADAHPNKDELFLSFCLVPDRRDRRRIALNRLFPPRIPPTLFDAHASGAGLRLQSKRGVHRARFIARRVLHHLRALSPVLRSGCRWWLAGRRQVRTP